ncbi:SGNH/GDSL hydrolase family protein [Baaleninema simplex]|uniref:SGNH/GDSL hydrolase family protein n=1 Tax=Baaleninema simplex TaxID=2862350 RepID=UPI001181B96B|nr:SGNH/GDSL hydrolase family protein [Baaleninema simplex]
MTEFASNPVNEGDTDVFSSHPFRDRPERRPGFSPFRRPWSREDSFWHLFSREGDRLDDGDDGDDTEEKTLPVFDSLLVFGDSLSDVGNVFLSTEGVDPPSPPYFNGRFSNGPLVVEKIADGLELEASIPFLAGGTNFAFGGARTGFGLSDLGTPNVGEQIQFYLNGQSPDETDLVYLYAGGNDFLQNPLASPESVVEALAEHVTTLAEAGAETFLVPNSADVSVAPFVQTVLSDFQDRIRISIEQFNRLLDTRLDELEVSLDIEIFELEINDIFDDILDDPDSFGFVNTSDPALNTVTGTVVENPDAYVFWDNVHPTRAATEIVFEELRDDLEAFGFAIDGIGEGGETDGGDDNLDGERDGLTGESSAAIAREETEIVETFIETVESIPFFESLSDRETFETPFVADAIAAFSEETGAIENPFGF